jgi:fibronectin type 3 domain-containing protein
LNTPIVTSTTTSEDEATINWQDNNTAETGYAIHRAPDAGGTPGTFQLVGTTPANQTSFTDVSLTSNTRYFYRIQALSATPTGNSAFTADISVQTQVVLPVAPSHLNALALSSTEVLVEWKDNASNESGYEIFRSPDGNVATFTLLTTTASNAESFVDLGLSSKTTYYYKVRATSVDGPSPFTEAVLVTTPSNAPVSPSDLVVSPVSASEMQLTWADNSTNETAFIIKRTTDRFAGFSTVDTVTVNTTTYLDSDLTDNTTYFYYVQAYNSAGLADKNSNIASGQTADVPLVPSNIQVTNNGAGSITISWDVNNAPSVIREADGFKIEAATILGVKPTTGGRYTHFANGRKVYRTHEDNDLVFFQVGTANGRSFQMNNIIANLTYVFRVRAYNDKGNSPYTAESIISSTPDPSIPVPSAPENLVAESVSQTEIDLRWEDKSTNELFFRIERRKEGVDIWTEVGLVIKGTTSFSSTGLEPDQKYYFRVRAGNQGGESAYTNVASTKSECNLIVLVTNVSGSNMVCAGKTTLLKVNTNVTEATYQWKRNGINIPDANLPLYNASQLGKYECLVISGKCRSASANSIVVIVTSAFDVTISVSDSASNTLTANFKGAETYQWYRDYQPIAGATESSYQANTDGSYFVIATSQGCSVTSNLINWVWVVTSVGQTKFSKSIKLTPNPAQRHSWLEIQNDIMGPYKILVTDLQGRVQVSLKGVKHQKTLRKL